MHMGMRDILRQEKERGSGAGALVWLPGEPGKDVREWPGKMVFASPGMEPRVKTGSDAPLGGGGGTGGKGSRPCWHGWEGSPDRGGGVRLRSMAQKLSYS